MKKQKVIFQTAVFMLPSDDWISGCEGRERGLGHRQLNERQMEVFPKRRDVSAEKSSDVNHGNKHFPTSTLASRLASGHLLPSPAVLPGEQGGKSLDD